MAEIKTYVIIDLETNIEDIRDLCLIAVPLMDIRNITPKKLPSRMSKLSFKISKKKPSENIQKYLNFTEIFNTIEAFISGLEKPVCLVAHNGKCLDYKVLHNKCAAASVSLPDDLLCVDSLHILRKIFNNEVRRSTDSASQSASAGMGSTIDNLSSLFGGMSTSPDEPETSNTCVNLPSVYKKIFGAVGNKKYTRVEDECLKMLRIIVNQKNIFLPISAENSKFLSECNTSNGNTIKPEIKTFVVIKLMKTTAKKDKQIREMCLIAITTNDLKNTTPKKLPSMLSRLSFINTDKNTSGKAQDVPIFKDIFNTINTFLKDLEKPVCLVACSGNRTDYRMLVTECASASVALPADLLCVDSRPFLKEIAKILDIKEEKRKEKERKSTMENQVDSEDSSSAESSESENTAGAKVPKTKYNCKLTNIYRKLYEENNDGKSVVNYSAHNAEDDCLMLLHCIVEKRELFLPLSVEARMYFSELKK